MNMFPTFTITELEDVAHCLVGTLSRKEQGKEKWVADGWVGCLLKGNVIAFGRWSENGESWQFKFDEEERNKLMLSVGDQVYVIDGYWGERIELALDKTIDWKQSKFEAKENSDHEHCSICWEKISDYENTTYFLGNARYPVCISCYDKHVKPGDVSFVPSA